MITVKRITDHMMNTINRMGYAWQRTPSRKPAPVTTDAVMVSSTGDKAHFIFTTDGDLIACDEHGHPLADLPDDPLVPASVEHHSHPAA